MLACDTSCVLTWDEAPRTITGQITLRRDFQGRPPDLAVSGSLKRVTVVQSPAGSSGSGMAVTVWP